MSKKFNGIEFPLGAERTDGFSPDERMEAVRGFAFECWELSSVSADGAGRLLGVRVVNLKPINKWIAKTREPGHRIHPPMSMREWKSWESLPGFMEWWQEEFPSLGGVSRTDALIYEAQMWQAISDGMEAGDMAAVAKYIDATGKKKRAEEQNEGGTLDEHFGDTSSDPFFDGKAAEA